MTSKYLLLASCECDDYKKSSLSRLKQRREKIVLDKSFLYLLFSLSTVNVNYDIRGGRPGYPAWKDNNDSSDSQDPPQVITWN